jgi:hypothetical protein
MQYMLLIYADESAGAGMTPEEGAKLAQEYTDYSQWLVDKGWMRGGEPLHDTPHATTVRVRNGEAVTTDGPFAETKEQLGGYYIVDCENLDQAIEAASKIPSAVYGSIEVRPIAEM